MKMQHVQAGRCHAQAVRRNNEQAQNALQERTISQALLKIMVKLDQQESLNRTILDRVTKLEHDSKRRAIANSQKQWGSAAKTPGAATIPRRTENRRVSWQKRILHKNKRIASISHGTPSKHRNRRQRNDN
jgi:hypothetical protein